ncbi:phage terminase small subunit [[Clostridium] scindens]|uniref:phage terminase small subunit n=1 Tax=Clostridium scindens (strain JCM 10418 / VPI 12708) TaxID=29347 RepID=UPI002097C1E0|nr:phage terminase small subunit [[Clostridium] scindens]MCO7171566.1 phage terminase small subunit [[Clostridium] scindens]
MPKQRSPDSYKAEELYKSGMKLVEIASQLNVSEGTVRSWKNRYRFDGSNATLRKNNRNVAKKKHGGQPGNKNAVGHGAPKGNQNARKHGLFSRYLPEDTLEIFNALDDVDPLDLLWDQIRLAYTAILRAQPIMYVKDKDDKTKSKIEKKRGNVSGEKWEIQYAWDKQASFLAAQAKAQSELRNMIRQYDELLHKNWDLASEEQKARIDQMKANTERLKRDADPDDGEGVEIINDAPAGKDI